MVYNDDIKLIAEKIENNFNSSHIIKNLKLFTPIDIGKVAVILHIGNIYLIKYFIKKLSNLRCEYDLFITINSNVKRVY